MRFVSDEQAIRILTLDNGAAEVEPANRHARSFLFIGCQKLFPCVRILFLPYLIG